MALDLSNLHEISFKRRVTTIDRKQTDKLIKLAEEFTSKLIDQADQANEKNNGSEFNYAPVLEAIIEAPKTAFCLYCLAIIHCYSVLESNRNEIIGMKFHEIEKLDIHLKKIGVKHCDVDFYTAMDEFRKVNNAIKHSRIGSSTKITTKDGKEYSLQQLRNLYTDTSESLEKYLAALHEKINII